MKKEVIYKGKKYMTEIRWSGSSYLILIDGKSAHSIPNNKINDIESIKEEFKKAIDHKHELHLIEEWDGNI